MGHLLFVDSASELDRACREISEYFSFRRRQSSLTSHALYGAWIEPNALSCIPFTLAPPSWPSSERCFLIQESFGISGIWELARLHVASKSTGVLRFPDLIIEALCAVPGAKVGLFAPVFATDQDDSEVSTELDRLNACYAGLLAPPLMQCPDTGELSWHPIGCARQ